MKLICVSSYKAKQKQNENDILNLWQFCVEMSQFNGSGNSDLAKITAMWVYLQNSWEHDETYTE
jgi:hypothetical protein